MTLLVHNEEEMLAANLDYHLAQGVEFVIVTDHASTDATPEILSSYEQQGVVRVIRVEGSEHHQSRRVTHMARLAAIDHAADWVIHNDADEFWWSLVGNLGDVLSAVPEGYGQIVAPRHNFLPRSVNDDRPFHQRLVIRERLSLNLEGEPLEPKVVHRGHPAVVVDPGNHSIRDVPLHPTPRFPLLEVLHFPMRTYEQFESKVIATGIGYESLAVRGEGVGRDQLRLLDLLRGGRLREYFNEQVLSEDAIASGLMHGQLVIDRRFAQFMAEPEDPDLKRLVRISSQPDGEAARKLISALFRGLTE